MNDDYCQTEVGRLNTNPGTVLFSIVQTQRGLNQNLKAGTIRFIDDARERKCSRCGEWWPWDTEFYSPKQTHCRACEADRARLKRPNNGKHLCQENLKQDNANDAAQ